MVAFCSAVQKFHWLLVLEFSTTVDTMIWVDFKVESVAIAIQEKENEILYIAS